MQTHVLTALVCGALTLGAAAQAGGTTNGQAPAKTTTPPALTAPTVPLAGAPLPAWVPVGWSQVQLDTMLELVGAELERRGLAGVVNLEGGFMSLTSGFDLGLVPLANSLSVVPPTEWAAVVATYVDAIMAGASSSSSDYAVVAPSLRIRMGELAAVGAPPGALLAQPVAGDLMAMVVIDRPDSVSFVTADAAASWGVSAAEIVLTATAQTLTAPLTPAVDNGVVTVAGDYYAATRILDPTTVVDVIGADGLVISIPNSDFFVATPVAAVDIELLIRHDLQNAQDYAQYPLPVSDDMYWWHDGVIEVIRSGDQSLQLPPGLDAILAGR